MNNLNSKMQERLDKWRKNTTPVVSASKLKQKNYIPRKDYGDDIAGHAGRAGERV